ncbi:uncharacterized protein LOC105420948 [Amborella trichopoda]|uniref:uncharacterized protein LOC105420948 n=1 Tax=Amborella trichopoda TaxID=13333 RepID=UPI0005D3D6D8|nr:uncharacterized protein LOC105420948 [Amborella trichopoda]|eukprot:XP_011624825.1 uncharacterized protein LOC105420948 [Amborella trichopoda]
MGSLSSVLPGNVMIKILAPLPAEGLYRLKMVSSSWEELISSSFFGRIHSLTLHSPVALFVTYSRASIPDKLASHMYLVCDVDFADPFSYRIAAFQPEKSSRISSSNGILCYHGCNTTDFVLGNPLLRKKVATIPDPIAGLSHLSNVFGFHFDPITRNFKILACFYSIRYASFASMVLFNSTTWSWRTLRKQPPVRCVRVIKSIGSTCYILSGNGL